MICPTCGKVYQRNTKAFIEHCRKCGTGKRSLAFDSLGALGEVLNACLQRIASLEKEVAALKCSGPVRTSVIDWLSTQTRPAVFWREFIESMPLDVDRLDTERDMCSCAASWLGHAIAEGQPICAFRTLPKCVFAYSKDGWIQFDRSMSEWLFDYVARRFLEVFQAWSQQNTSLIESDKHNAIYFQRLQKITQSSIDRTASAHRMVCALHKHMCVNNPPGVSFAKV